MQGIGDKKIKKNSAAHGLENIHRCWGWLQRPMGRQEAVFGGGASKKEKMHSVEWLMPTPKKKYGPSLP